jgi:hypothetical protein
LSDLTQFRGGITDIGRSLISDQLQTNLCSWCSWAMLGIGGFYNVTIPSSGSYGGNPARLRLVEEPNYDRGQVWEGFRQDWVWETGVEWATQPIRVSGVYVDGNFQPVTGVGPYAHHVNYPLGRVIFDTAINPSAVVTAEFSHRFCSFSPADVPWWREVQQNSFRVDDNHFLQEGSGAWSVLAQNRVQLPAVVVDAVPRVSFQGLALGGGTIRRQDVTFQILTESPWAMHQLTDILTYQWQKRLTLFDANKMADASGLPLDYDGSPATGTQMYPDWIKPTDQGGFGWEQLRVVDIQGTPQPMPPGSPLHWTTVRWTIEVDLP